MAKFYAVKEGKKPGIYHTWDECKEQVNGYSGAVYKSFTNEEEAKAFIKKEERKVSDDLTLLAYVDGSYNVSGEILGCMKAIAYAIDHHYESICIYYDYEGIEKWATGLWKANKEQTQNYVKTIQEMKKEIDIYFQKVLAHSGDYYNEVADGLAKKAVGIKK